MFRQHRKLADNLRQFAIARPVESKFDLALADFLDVHDMPVVGAVKRTVLLQTRRMKKNVIGRDRLPVMPACVRAQTVSDVRMIFSDS